MTKDARPPSGGSEASEESLRRMASAAIAARRLPARPPDSMRGGHGIGAKCIVCERAVTHEEFGLEIEFHHDDGSRAQYGVHIACFWAWEIECAASSRSEALSDAPAEGNFSGSERERP